MIKNLIICFIIFGTIASSYALDLSLDKKRALVLKEKNCKIVIKNQTNIMGRIPVTENVWLCPDGSKHSLNVDAL